MSKSCLLPFDVPCETAEFVRREKRFIVTVSLHGRTVQVHSNNTGSMLGLLRPGMPVLVSPAQNPHRRLPYTQEAVWVSNTADLNGNDGFWVGVNTLVPNRLLEAAFRAGRLPFAEGYSSMKREVAFGSSRFDACCTAAGKPPLWIECKNVTLVEDDAACFPDAASQRGCRHLRELVNVVKGGARAAMFYVIQRADGHCFAPADFIDAEYARLFEEALHAGVEMYPYRVRVSPLGMDLEEAVPLACRLK